jgi:predicted DNA-binding transcriptional regulator AlpA
MLFPHRLKRFVKHMSYAHSNASPLDPLLTLREVAKIIGRSVRHVWREIDRGNLPKPVRGRPARLFESDVVKYQEGLRQERDGKPNDRKEKI